MIIQWITDWIKEILVSGIISNLSGMFDNVNQKVAEIAFSIVDLVRESGMTLEQFAALFAAMKDAPMPVIQNENTTENTEGRTGHRGR